MRRGLWLGGGWRQQVAVTAGTIFQDTRSALPLWLRARWSGTSQKNGTSALGGQRGLGRGSYATAWTWWPKLRRAMVRPGRDQRRGPVAVAETDRGGSAEGVAGRATNNKALLVSAAEQAGAGIGRIRRRRMMDAAAACWSKFIPPAVAPGSGVHTDGWQGDAGLEEQGSRHQVSVIGARRERAAELLPRVHRLASLRKRWLLGTHQGAPRLSHLAYDLAEFTFRFNRRNSRSRGKLFYRLVQQAVQIEPKPYKRIVNPQRVGAG
jgi:transposase-like protein